MSEDTILLAMIFFVSVLFSFVLGFVRGRYYDKKNLGKLSRRMWDGE